MALFAARHFDNNKTPIKISSKTVKISVKSYQENDQQNDYQENKEHEKIFQENDSYENNSQEKQKKENFISIEIVAIPCVGSSDHLLEQMIALDEMSGNCKIFPYILNSVKKCDDVKKCDIENNVEVDVKNNIVEKNKNYRDTCDRVFGTPYLDHFRIHEKLKNETGIEFDLIYTPRAIELLLDSFKNNVNYWEDCNVLYYHCGGVEGNESQLGRYKYNKLI